jgi:hypothetical protein
VYIDFDFYAYKGGNRDITDATFTASEFRARKLVDRLTQGRVKNMAEVPEAVKMLMVELITLEATQGASAAEHPAVTSFTNDGYSETYADPLTGERVKEIEYDLVLEYLSGETDDGGTPLLYLGVS